MKPPVVGWEQNKPIPNNHFNEYLSAQEGRLFYDDLDLAQLFLGDRQDQGLKRILNSPLEIIYLPRIRHNIDRMYRIFSHAIDQVGYDGDFHYAYASKANAAEEVVRTTLRTGAHHEISSAMDLKIVQVMNSAGNLKAEQMVICNGFKSAGTDYANGILELKTEHTNVIPVIENIGELSPLIESDLPFDVGLRQKSYGHHKNMTQMDAANSRFGMTVEDIWQAVDIIAAAPNLHLKLYHAMVGSQIIDADDFVARLKPPIEIYAQLRQVHPELSIFDFGGGVPVAMTLDFAFDYAEFASLLLKTIKEVCGGFNVPVPDVMGEFGRYTVAEHGAHLFKILSVKTNASKYPWYIIDGSIMTSFPDSWALGEHFIVLPLNNLGKPFQQVQLGGITCDSDDVYPPGSSESPLYLPVDTENLYIGFFGIGAYQEMLGGVGGSKHCVIPEADELIIDRDSHGAYEFHLIPGQSAGKVLRNLGYKEIAVDR